MKKEVFDAVFRWTFNLLLFSALAVLVYFYTPVRGIWRVQRHMRELATAPDVREVALACSALLAAASAEQSFNEEEELKTLPAIIYAKHPKWVSIKPESRTVTIGFGGGFAHYGYRLEPLPSDPTRSRFVMIHDDGTSGQELLQL